MLDISKLSSIYAVRILRDSDADEILDLCMQNTQYYRYCNKKPSKALVLNDLHRTPPGIGAASKYFIGFYEGAVLVAIMDLIEGYPNFGCCYIGFFMMNKRLQGKQIGSGIIREVCRYLKECGFASVHLGMEKDNPQSTHFWKKNGFAAIKETERDGVTVLVAEKTL
ncbi:MAG: GNAT family N-acetyltransferase [Christensenellales bacterium]|jgi:RimJ/RimL family protein N-acetyltransferase